MTNATEENSLENEPITACPNCHIDLEYGDNLFSDPRTLGYFYVHWKDKPAFDHYITLEAKCANCNKKFRSIWLHIKNTNKKLGVLDPYRESYSAQ